MQTLFQECVISEALRRSGQPAPHHSCNVVTRVPIWQFLLDRLRLLERRSLFVPPPTPGYPDRGITPVLPPPRRSPSFPVLAFVSDKMQNLKVVTHNFPSIVRDPIIALIGQVSFSLASVLWATEYIRWRSREGRGAFGGLQSLRSSRGAGVGDGGTRVFILLKVAEGTSLGKSGPQVGAFVPCRGMSAPRGRAEIGTSQHRVAIMTGHHDT